VYGFLFPVGSYNGLLCLYSPCLTNNNAKTLLYIWNPATKKLSNKIVFLAKPRDEWTFAFGYVNLTKTYKIVAFNLMDNVVRVLSVGDNIWRNIQSFPVVPTYCVPSLYQHWHPSIKQGVYVRGTLNWLTIRNKFQIDITIDQFVIISLDLSTETYRQLLPPWGFDTVPSVQPTLAVLMHSLCFCHDFRGTDFVIWQMKKFGVQESWTQFLKINYQNLHNLVPLHRRIFLFPVCLCENGNTLILTWGLREKAILYNWRDITVKEPRISRSISHEIEWHLAKDYVESLVSIG
jgi:F-box interacting protein